MGQRQRDGRVSGLYRLIWEVAGADPKIGSALAIDNVRVNGNLLFGFEGGIPGGFESLGTVGTSGSVPVSDPVGGTNPPAFSPTEGSLFAYMDISGRDHADLRHRRRLPRVEALLVAVQPQRG